ncbi:hypothetical protein ACLBOM_37530 [Escherichia coli]
MKLRHPFWLAAPLLLLAGCHSTGKAPVTSPRPVTTISIPLNNLTPEGWQFPEACHRLTHSAFQWTLRMVMLRTAE